MPICETWRPVEDYPEYDVSDLGRVRRNGRALKQYDNGTGYLRVALSKAGRVKFIYVHRLVALAFHGSPQEGQSDAAHWNGDRQDNRASNLRWTSRSENMADSRRLGRDLCGERSHLAKLTDQQVLEIRQLRTTGMTYAALAVHFGRARNTIRDICQGRRWQHLLMAKETK